MQHARHLQRVGRIAAKHGYWSRIGTRQQPMYVRHQCTTAATAAQHTASNASSHSSQSTAAEQRERPRFDNATDAYRSKTLVELLRAYAVFRLCSIDTLVNHHTKLLGVARRVLGRRLFRWSLRKTIYGQFMAGETRQEVLQAAEQHSAHRVTPMFAYTAAEVHGHVTESEKVNMEDLWTSNYHAMMESLEYSAAVRGDTGIHTKVSGKLTFLASPQLLESLTSIINTNVHWMSKSLTNSNQLHHMIEDAMPDMLDLSQTYNLPVPADHLLQKGTIHDLSTSVVFSLAIRKQLKNETPQNLSSEETRQLRKLINWCHDIFQKAKYLGVCMINDAEQTYLQGAIDTLTVDLMRVYNKDRAVVHNTYQCYLRRTRDRINHHLQLAHTEGFSLGGKIVRGAYMEEERALAQANQREDPVNPTYDATTAMYHGVVDDLLHAISAAHTHTPQVTFATHNEDTVRYVLDKSEEMNLDLHHNAVSFAQLMGMRDHIAFPLGACGYPSCKLLHYGPIEQGVAYMSRRLQENRSIMPTANNERDMMAEEIGHRLWRRRTTSKS